MRLIRYRSADGPAWATLAADGRTAHRLATSPLSGAIHLTSVAVPAAELGARLAPVELTNLIGVGLNYRAHAAESGKPPPAQPMWFLKTTNALQHPGAPIVLPRTSQKVDYEGELAVVLGRPARAVPAARAADYILGYTLANDVSARDWQFEWGSGQFCHGKSFDTFCPLGPELVTPDELGDPAALTLETRVNGELRQRSSVADLIFNIPSLIEFLSQDRTLPAGTVILTGTPSGVGYAHNPPKWLAAGDTVEISCAGIGTLRNPVVAFADSEK
jgi:2-keto-4-pentenoate hydratase/2-oxohepta-3-ene-1,7-dioic acid hydratase in catechol pathway